VPGRIRSAGLRASESVSGSRPNTGTGAYAPADIASGILGNLDQL
jgi:hypothetical protein